MWASVCVMCLAALVGAAMVCAEAADTRGIVSGVVVDAATGKGVFAAVVVITSTGQSDTTIRSGAFHIDSVPVGTTDISVSAIGFQPRMVPAVNVQSGKNQALSLDISKSTEQKLPTMLVTASRILVRMAYQTTSVLRARQDEIRNAPGAIEDINRVVQSQPSAVSSADQEDNSYYVRGGSDRENTFLIDGIELNNLSHWGSEYGSGGSITMLNPMLIKTMDYYAGGIPVKCPPRISSVVDITLRDGDTEARNYEIDANVAGFGLFLEGPLARKRANYMATARVSFLRLVQPLLGVIGTPQYQDAQTRVAYDFSENNKLIFNLLGGSEYYHEDARISRDQLWSQKQAGKHAVGGLTWRTRGSTLSNETVVSGLYQQYGEKGSTDSSFVWKDTGNKRKKVQLKDNLTIFLRESDQLSVGAVVEREEYFDRNVRDRAYLIAHTGSDSTLAFSRFAPDSTDPNAPLLVRIDTARTFDATAVGLRVGGHLGYSLSIRELSFNAGIRSDYFSLLRKGGVSPRVGVTLGLDKVGELGVSAGVGYQYPTYAEVFLVLDHSRDLELQRCYDAVGSFRKQIGETILANAELYYKFADREPLYVATDSCRYMLTDFKEYGRKKTWGLEISVQKKRRDKFFYQFSYTYFDSRVMYQDGVYYDSDLNLHNAGAVLLGSQINRNHSICASLDVTQGAPYTPVDFDASLSRAMTIYDISDGWNSQRRSTRFQLSLRYDIKLYGKRLNLTGYFEVQNILNERDVVSEEYRQGTTLGTGYIHKVKSRGIFPITGLTLDF
jgi:hypothetical protein